MDDTIELTNETAARLRRAVTRLNRRLRSSAMTSITPTQASMLASIEKCANPSLGDLAVAEQIQPPSVTRIVQAMTESGLVSCAPDPRDRRCTRVTLTTRGRRELEAIRRRKTEFLERTLQSLPAKDQRKAEELVTFLERLLEVE